MNQKQLANVLIKILGLYCCVDGLVRMLSGFLNLFAVLTRGGFGSLYTWLNPFIGLVPLAIGFLFVVFSRSIADFLFKDE